MSQFNESQQGPEFEHFFDENARLESLLVRFNPNKVYTHPRTTNCNKVAQSDISVGRLVEELEPLVYKKV